MQLRHHTTVEATAPPSAHPRGGPGAWHAHAAARRARTPLRDDVEADVAIVGGGFSGLWTAYHLLVAEPSLRVMVVERDAIGFGASGRNGGWLMGAAPADLHVWERAFGLDVVRLAQRVLIDGVAEVAAVVEAEGIACSLRLAGSLTLARSPAEVDRLQRRRHELEHHGWPGSGLRWLAPEEVEARIGAAGTLGSLVTEPCGTLDPVALVRGLARAVEARGGRIFERTPVTGIGDGVVQTHGAVVRAPKIVVATEAFTVQQPGARRRYLPLASTMIATDPLPATLRRELGWAGGEAVGDARHLFFYAQMTPDGRIAIGGRGAPYRLGSALAIDGAADPATTARLEATLAAVWPQTQGTRIAHRWSGSLAVPRDWCASCGVDEAGGTAWIGGYAGHGVGASFVLARSLAAQLRGAPDPAGPQPWSRHRARRWEPEPLRWLASQAIVRVLASADEVEAAGGRGRRAGLVRRFTAG